MKEFGEVFWIVQTSNKKLLVRVERRIMTKNYDGTKDYNHPYH